MAQQEKAYHGIVDKVVRDGKHGSYAVARCKKLGYVTFSLDRKVWQESDIPEAGMCVVLTKLRKKPAGWRAQCGRFLQPSDEQPE